MKKILVIRMSSIGDIVLATSFLKSVKQKHPDSEIHFLIKKEFSELVKKHPIIDKLISFDKKLGLNELFRLGRFLSCLLYTSPSPRDAHESRMPSSA